MAELPGGGGWRNINGERVKNESTDYGRFVVEACSVYEIIIKPFTLRSDTNNILFCRRAI